MENNNGKGIFYGVIGVATLVVAIIGATFAYFASTTNGAQGAAAANSARVSGALEVAEVKKYIAKDLIPTSGATMLTSYKQSEPTDVDHPKNNEKCRGASAADASANYGLCSYYTFTVSNTADVATTVYLSLKTETNTFGQGESGPANNEYLKYCVYKQSDQGSTFDTEKPAHACGLVPTGATEEQFTNVNLPATSGTATYSLVIYLENDDAVDQTSKYSGKVYTGTVYASTSTEGKNIVGVIAAQQ